MSRSMTFLIARHGLATGNQMDAPLSPVGLGQAEQLAGLLAGMENVHIDKFLSSPYRRAWQTAEIIEKRLSIKLEQADRRLKEKGVQGFDEDETDEEVLSRVTGLAEELLEGDSQTVLLVTHRLTMTLLMNRYDPSFTLEQGRHITNPDLYELKFTHGNGHVKRLLNAVQHQTEPAQI
ncbi:histidine phosphatase family protein [Paenibacillus sonchi]|uniref:Histidine phosphatase family protein n=1 Tax=Paenibacillus sonchi TaxID=373687 RepID=A0A974PBL3_9BACL|nr:histidine phosphatase family protein [Paenibacillus sonchi]QQZ60378.1 histidine phosphatase family protein [Paenibacillus sonchi]